MRRGKSFSIKGHKKMEKREKQNKKFKIKIN
jgi:hypothetical protein